MGLLSTPLLFRTTGLVCCFQTLLWCQPCTTQQLVLHTTRSSHHRCPMAYPGQYSQPPPTMSAPVPAPPLQKRDRKPLPIINPDTKEKVQVASQSTATVLPSPASNGLYPAPPPPANIVSIVPEPEPSDVLTRSQTIPSATMVTVPGDGAEQVELPLISAVHSTMTGPLAAPVAMVMPSIDMEVQIPHTLPVMGTMG